MLTLVPNGDASLIIYLDSFSETQISEAALAQVTAVTARIHEWVANGQLQGIVDIVPAYRSVMLTYNLEQTDVNQVKQCLNDYGLSEFCQQLCEQSREPLHCVSSVIEIPVCYHDSLGVDIAELAQHCQLSVDEVIARHTAPDYSVYMLGFMPGFLYLGGLDKRIEAPRKTNPREKIAAGSVGIAGQQTGIYPFASPGGWQIIGRTPVTLFDPQKMPPVLAEPGQKIRFVPITLDEFQQRENPA